MVVLMEDDEVKVGDRVEVSGDRGKVLYVGPVPPSKGTWVGIDWDDPARGKHNGTHAGVEYFKARYETSGSLVRLEKLSPRQSVVSAIVDRYDGTDIDLDSDTVHQIEKAIKAPFLMLVGFDKVADKQSYNCLKIIGLRGMRVCGPGESEQLSKLCPNIEEMDLAKNLMNSWNTVAQITCQCPHLTFLDLSENRLSYDEEVESLRPAFAKLEFLVLSRVEYTWDDVLHCACMWPHIVKLQVSYNRISRLTPPQGDIFKGLTLLSLEGNSISDWNEILKLGHLNKLEILNVSHTDITQVWFPTPNYLFTSLQYILLSGNFISRWESINELNKLSCLNEVKFRDNPVLNGLTRETARQILIARLHNIKILNGQEIDSDERRGAEYDYLKQNAKAWHAAKSDLKKMLSFTSLHPSYQRLVSVYGEIDECEFETKSTALKNKLVNVTFKHGDRCLSKKLPLNMSVQKLSTLLHRLFQSDCNNLLLVSAKNPELKVPLEDEMKDLSFYSLEEGDNILVQT